MSWRKVSDDLHSHPKWGAVSLAARGLWVTCLSWTGQHATDGAVPDFIVRQHAGAQGRRLADELVRAGLWKAIEGQGWAFHDYHDYQPLTAEEREHREHIKAVRSEAGRNGAAKRWGNHSNPDSNCHDFAMANGKQPDSPVPVPVLDTNTAAAANTPRTPAREEPEGFPDAHPMPPPPPRFSSEIEALLPRVPEDIAALVTEGKTNDLLRRFLADYPERKAEAQGKLAASKGPVGNKGRYLQGYILEVYAGREPEPDLSPAPAQGRSLKDVLSSGRKEATGGGGGSDPFEAMRTKDSPGIYVASSAGVVQ